jgi:hypothetical protein
MADQCWRWMVKAGSLTFKLHAFEGIKMFTSRKMAAAAAVLALAVAVPVASVSALPPPGGEGGSDDPGGGRPTTTRPQSTTASTAPRTLRSLSVTTDSVVATAIVYYNGTPGVITVQWGDGSTSSRDPNVPIDSPRPQPNPDPPGRITFKHSYAAPTDGTAFARSVTAQAAGESSNLAVIVTPRYRVTQYSAYWSSLDSCDLDVELETEWRVERRLPSYDKTWAFNAPNLNDIPSAEQALPDSILSFELTVPNRKQIEYQVTELDLVIDNLGQTRVVDLDPRLGSRSVTLDYHDFDSCEAQLRFDIDVKLLTPGLGGGPIASQ